MLRTIRVLCATLALATAGTWAPPAQACPMCKVANEDNPDPSAAARPRAYMYSILFMLSMPASLTAFFGVTFYRMSRKHQSLNAALLSEADDRS